MQCIFSELLLSAAFFFKNQLIQKFLSGILSECQTDGSRSGPLA